MSDLFFKSLNYFATLLIVVFAVFFVFAIYESIFSGGYYCEYCHEGVSNPVKKQVEWQYQDIPCQYNKEDSCHHFIYFINKPKRFVRYKYIR